nr:hypothetical protein [Microvirga mediterraneensis]
MNAAIPFGGVCLVLGALGAMMIDAESLLTVYGIATLGFATWAPWDTYQGCRPLKASGKD